MSSEQPAPGAGIDYARVAAAWRLHQEAMARAAVAYAKAMVPVLAAAREAMATLAKATAATRDAYALAPPPARTDRPAWQSPYGPAHRHRT